MKMIRLIWATTLCSLLAVSSAAAFEATVVSASGKAEVQNGNNWVQLTKGAKINKGAVIQTGFKSELVLQIKESVVTVAPLSRLTIEQLAEKDTKDETRVHLDTGSLKSNVKKVENRRVGFTVKSPVATASVRGTELNVTVGFGSTDVETLSGSVAVWAADNHATISSDAEDAAEAPIAAQGFSAQDISDGEAPKGAFTVNAGQTASFTQAVAPEPPQAKAANNAIRLGMGTRSASAAEAVALAGPAQMLSPGFDPFAAGNDGAKKGSAIIILTFPTGSND